ncbi:MAG TPA: hypothetical protein VNM34_03065 [Verrucomicrobiae bacterium]|nr:hypothetical protein [Verrucomicrobiae bacterium]
MIRRRLIALFATGLVAAWLLPPAATARPRPDEAARAEAIASALESRGASQAAIDRMLAARLGWLRSDVGTDGAVAPMSSTQLNASISQPAVYYSTAGHYWIARAQFSWHHNCGLFGNTECWYADCFAQGNCGGPDGFALRSTRALNEDTTYFYTYDEKGNLTAWAGPDEMNEAGASWVTTDRLNGSQFPSGIGEKYNWDHGTLYYYFHVITCTGLRGAQFKFYSRLYHSWQNTSITGVGVSVFGFSVATGGGPDFWPLGNNTATVAYLCGQ